MDKWDHQHNVIIYSTQLEIVCSLVTFWLWDYPRNWVSYNEIVKLKGLIQVFFSASKVSIYEEV